MKSFSAPFRRLLGAAGLILAARAGGAVCTVLALFILTNTLTPQEVGFVVAAQAAGAIGALFVTMNQEGGAVRYLPQWREGERHLISPFMAMLRRTALFTLPPISALAVGYGLLSGGGEGLSFFILVLMAFMVPAAAALRVGVAVAHGFGAVATSGIYGMGVRPLLFMALLAALWGTSTLTLSTGLAAAVLAFALSALGVWLVVRKQVPGVDSESASTATSEQEAEWRRTGLILMLTVLFVDEFPATITLLAGLVLSSADLALLAIALRFAFLLRMATTALVMSIGPALSGTLGAGDENTANTLLRQSVRVNAALGLAGAALLWIFAEPLLSVFGQDYEKAANALRLLTLLPLTSAFFGPSLLVLTIVGAQKAILRVTIIGLCALGIGVLVGGFLGGLEGVSLGVVAAFFLWEAGLFRAVRREARLTPWLPRALADGSKQ